MTKSLNPLPMLFLLAGPALSEEKYEVPDFISMTKVAAAERLQKDGITFEISDTGPCKTDVITRHYPTAGDELDQSREVVFLQTGLPYSVIPSSETHGLVRVLKAMDLAVKTEVSPPDGSPGGTGGALICYYKERKVDSTSPSPGQNVCPGSTITVYYKEHWRPYDCR